jgi:predicted metal-dependent phosphoesterase TrpH
MEFANLHIHSIFSDGQLDTRRLAEEIYQEPDLVSFALTDHDTLSGIEPMLRSKRYMEKDRAYPVKQFIPGVELSLVEPKSSMTVHLLGYFPWITHENQKDTLAEINKGLERYCTERTVRRGKRDLDERVRCAWNMNLDGIADRYPSADEIIRMVHRAAGKKAEGIFRAEGKTRDVIHHPIPLTYQALIDHWKKLAPESTTAHITNYILRRDRKRIKELESLYLASDIDPHQAHLLASDRQGVLNRCLPPPSGDMPILEGLAALKKAGAVTVLAHPAVEHFRFDYDTVDNLVVKPLADAGLHGIEVFYPYDEKYRQEATDHYLEISKRLRLLVSGGTDYHGDGRSTLRDVELSVHFAELLFKQGQN